MSGIWKHVLLGAALVAVGCGGGDEKKSGGGSSGGEKKAPAANAGGGDAAGGAYDAAKSTGAVKMTVKWTGAKPNPQAVPITEPTCKTGADVMAERFVVNADGTLPYAFVWASDGPHKKMSGLPKSEHVTLDQKGCMYSPHVFGLRVGESFTVKNSDGVKHNVHARPSKQAHDLNQSQDKGATNDFTFDKVEKAIPFNCDVHSWMNATAFVLDHPFFGTTGADGTVTIKGLPPGDYTFKVWHEGLVKPEAVETEVKVSVKDGETAASAELK